MFFFKKFLNISFLSLFILASCVSLPGINKSPSKKKPSSKVIESEYSIRDVGINIVKINSLSEMDIDSYNKNKIEEVDFKVKKFSNIYDYKYEYILGPADTISINLTDTDDLDNSYLIDQKGMIDLPFIGKVKLDGLTLNEAQNILMDVIKDFYKNPDLQINIEEFNSSKVYIVGAVRNQKTINLDQKPIKLIEAAIEANFNLSAADKLYGTKGFLRRDNEVYKINLKNAFSGIDESINKIMENAVEEASNEGDIEKVKNIVENSKGTLSNKLIDSANKNEGSKKKITEVIVDIVQENPEKAVEIIEKNQNTNTVTETIKTKIENNEAITTEDFEEVFETNVSPN